MTIHIYHDWSSKWQLRCIVIVNVRFNTRTRSNICEYLLLRVLNPNKTAVRLVYAYSIQTKWLYIRHVARTQNLGGGQHCFLGGCCRRKQKMLTLIQKTPALKGYLYFLLYFVTNICNCVINNCYCALFAA